MERNPACQPFLCLGKRIGVLLAVLAAGTSLSAEEKLSSLQPIEVELPSFATEVTESAAIEQAIPIDLDPVERELNLQRAIAASLKGDRSRAIDALEQRNTLDTAADYARAMWLMESGQIVEGVELLETISGRPDAPVEAGKFLAVGYLHLGKFDAALTAVDDYLSTKQDDGYAHYIRGLALLQQREEGEAKLALHQAGFDNGQVEQIQQVVLQAPVDVAQRRLPIDDPLSTLRRQSDARLMQEEKNYNLTLLFAGEYDSNVPLQPNFVGLGSDFRKEDYRFLMASFLDVQLLTCEEFNWGLVGSTYNTFQTELNEFNIQDYMGGSYVNALLQDDLIGAFRYEYHHTLVDESRFASEHRLTPSLTWLGSRGHTTLFYEFNPIDSEAPALIPSQFQSADIHRLGATQAVYTFGGDGRIYAGYQYANALADGADFDRDSHTVTGRVEVPMCGRWIADLDVRYVWDNYDNPNSLDFFERARDDDRLEVRAGLQRNFQCPVSLRLDYTYINNDSNTENLFGVRFYDYDRHIFSTQLIFSL